MHLHYFTLMRQVNTIRHRIGGATITESFTQVKNEWVIKLEKGGQEPLYLQLSTDPHYGYFLWHTQVHRRANSTNIFPQLLGAIIDSIALVEGERIIHITFQGSNRQLYLQYFPLNINFFLTQPDQTIEGAFKHNQQWVNKPFRIPENSRLDPMTISEQHWDQVLTQHPTHPIGNLLKQKFRYMTRPVLTELFARLPFNEETTPEALSSNDQALIFNEIQNFMGQFQTGLPYIYFDGPLPIRFTLGAFRSLNHLTAESFEAVNSALRVFCFKAIKWRTLIQKKEALLKRVEERIRFLERTIQKMVQESPADRADRYRKIGQLLLAQPHAIQPQSTQVELIDYFDPAQSTITVTVDPNKSAAENAARYFQKAKESEQNRAKRERRRNHLEQERNTLIQLQEQLRDATTEKQITKIEEALKNMHVIGTSKEEAAIIRVPYREFQFKSYTIWVGKSAADNDALTFKYAHKEDWWLHVQGYTGSHVIIRNPGREAHPPPEVLAYAARLAVTFSQARHARYVPVLVTQVKYVQKPRKSPPGTVIPQRTKTVFADPLSEHEL